MRQANIFESHLLGFFIIMLMHQLEKLTGKCSLILFCILGLSVNSGSSNWNRHFVEFELIRINTPKLVRYLIILDGISKGRNIFSSFDFNIKDVHKAG